MSTELELNIYALLGTSSKVISLLEMTAFLVGVFCFTRNIHIKSANTKAPSIESICTGSLYIGATNIGDIGGDTSIRDTD